jgi:hypothetical protein
MAACSCSDDPKGVSVLAIGREDEAIVNELTNALQYAGPADERLDKYYEGQQRLEHIGLAVPPELRRFETVVNWPRLCVDSLNERLDVKSFILPGEGVADSYLSEQWQANDLDSEAPKLHLDSFIYGRGFACIGTNEDDPEHPIVTIESPSEVAVKVDYRTRRVIEGLRLYGPDRDTNQPGMATLYLPDRTVWLERSGGGWGVVDRDDHGLGRVPIVPFFNRLRPGRWHGVSEMADVIPLTDAAARTLTNLQIAGETHSVPQKYVLGMSRGDFVDASGEPIPAWESYFSAIWANQNAEAKVGQFTASSLSNFHETVNHYARLVGAVAGLPPHFLGFSSENPASADAIRSSESRLVKRAELKQRQFGDSWGRVMAFSLRLRDGEWPDGRRIRTEWHDAATPTVAARTDAVVKLRAEGVLSREGVWDELGWSEARKERERAYLEAEALDPVTRALVDGVSRDAALGE